MSRFTASRWLAVRRALLATSLGVSFQLLGCNPESIVSFLGNVNPCGLTLECNPAAYDFLTSGIDGPGVRPSVDPFCTFPPFCTAAADPIFGGLNP